MLIFHNFYSDERCDVRDKCHVRHIFIRLKIVKNQHVIISVSYFEYCMLRMLYREEKIIQK